MIERQYTRSLLELPAEIRVMIYKYSLTSPIALRSCPNESPLDIRFNISLLLTCKLVYKEAIDFLYTSNYFVIPGQDPIPTKYPLADFDESKRYTDPIYLRTCLSSDLRIAFTQIRRLEIPHNALYLDPYLRRRPTYWNALIDATPSLEFLGIRIIDHIWQKAKHPDLLWFGASDFPDLLMFFILHRQMGMLQAFSPDSGSRGGWRTLYPILTAALRDSCNQEVNWASWTENSFRRCVKPRAPLRCPPRLKEIRLLGGQGVPFPWMHMLGMPSVSAIWKRYGMLEAKRETDKWGNLVNVTGTNFSDYNFFLRWKG